jgi:hypothetical protein
MTTQTATTHQANASHDYSELKQECARLLHSIIGQFSDDSEPANVNWGHVGDMADTRDQLREISDQLFGEG